jgi:predicted ATPase
MAQLRKLTVRGFKSIRELEDFELRSLNVLIGENGAGKSNLLSLFHMMAAIAQQQLQLYVQEHDGPDALLFGARKKTPQIEVELRFADNGYRATLRPAGERLAFAMEQFVRLGGFGETVVAQGIGHSESLTLGTRFEALHLLRASMASWRVYHFRHTSTEASVRQAQPVRDNLGLKADAGNLAPFLRFLRERHLREHERIVEIVHRVAPFFGDFVYRTDPGERVELEWFQAHDPDTPMSPRQLSDGTLRFICLATLLLQPAHLQPDPILIDEPELGLHPDAIALLAGLLRRAAEQRQLVVSTQSVELVNELSPEDVVVVSLQDGASWFERLEPDQLQHWLEDYALGELWKAHVVGDRPHR